MRYLIWTSLVLAVACGGSDGPPLTSAPISDTTRTVEGRVGYIQSAPNIDNTDAHGRLVPTPGLGTGRSTVAAPRVRVDVLGDDGRVIGTGTTDDGGNYSIDCNFGVAPATPVSVRVHEVDFFPFRRGEEQDSSGLEGLECRPAGAAIEAFGA